MDGACKKVKQNTFGYQHFLDLFGTPECTSDLPSGIRDEKQMMCLHERTYRSTSIPWRALSLTMEGVLYVHRRVDRGLHTELLLEDACAPAKHVRG